MARARMARPAWVAWGGLAIGALGAIALATTVIIARRALEGASEVVVRGEGDALVAALQAELRAASPDAG
ncbi:MAG TPA: hypothetical protein VGM56_07825, partial [Byssovorax sp.]